MAAAARAWAIVALIPAVPSSPPVVRRDASAFDCQAHAACRRTSFWVLCPESDANSTARALRHSWLRGAHMRCAVSPGPHEYAPGVTRLPMVPLDPQTARVAKPSTSGLHPQFSAGSEAGAESLRALNLFLQRKVYATLRGMCEELISQRFDHFVMLDADTAVNLPRVSERLGELAPSVPGYYGYCYHAAPPVVSGGPGIFLTRAMLELACPRLDECVSMLDPESPDALPTGGGDAFLNACLRSLAPRVQPGCSQCGRGGCPFRPCAPWVGEWMMHAARAARSLSQRRAVGSSFFQHHHRAKPTHVPGGTDAALDADSVAYPAAPFGGWRLLRERALGLARRAGEGGWLGAGETLTYHRVRPTERVPGLAADPRCAVWVRLPTQLEPGGWHHVSSTCAPHFVIAGAPKGGTTSLFRYLLQHPEVLPPARKELLFFRAVALGHAARRASEHHRRAYMALFPHIDPRDFKLTGEASPGYLYDAQAADLFGSRLPSVRVVLALRDPRERAFSEYKHKLAERKPYWTAGAASFAQLVSGAQGALARCGLRRLYDSQRAWHAWFCAGGGGSNAAWRLEPQCLERERHAPQQQQQPAAQAGAAAACVLPPVLFESWYQLVLPQWLPLGNRLLVLFSEELFADPQATVRRVSDFLELSAGHAFDTAAAYNAERQRGLDMRANSSAMRAADAARTRTALDPALRRGLGALMDESIQRTDEQLRGAGRSGVPSSWRAAT